MPEFLGEYAAQQESRRRMLLVGWIALAGIVVLPYSEFRAWRLVLLVMLSLLFALIAGVLGAWLGHEIEYPMALVILGGLPTSTLMNLFFIPSPYRPFGAAKRRAAFGDGPR